MSNQRQDEVDAFFGAINSPSSLRQQQGQQEQGHDDIAATTATTATNTSTNTTTTSSPGSRSQRQPFQPIFTAADSGTSLLLPESASPSLQSPSSGLPTQPGMTPAIQKGSVPLGLALGGSGFQRKPLFEAEDSDDGHGSKVNTRLEMLGSKGKNSQGKVKKKTVNKGQSTTLRELTRSEQEGDRQDGREGNDADWKGSEQDNDGIEEEEEEGDGDDDDEEDDTNSETPLNPHEQIRGLE